MNIVFFIMTIVFSISVASILVLQSNQKSLKEMSKSLKRIEEKIESNNYVLLNDGGKEILMHKPFESTRYNRTLTTHDIIEQLLTELEQEDKISVLQNEIDNKVDIIEKSKNLRKVTDGKMSMEEYERRYKDKIAVFYFSYKPKVEMYEDILNNRLRRLKNESIVIKYDELCESIDRLSYNDQDVIDIKNALKSTIKEQVANKVMSHMDV